MNQLTVSEAIQNRLAQAERVHRQTGRPLVTLGYAQSLDGCIALVGSQLNISNNQAFTFIHRLRAVYQAILAGIGTVLSDKSRLTVRLAAGETSQPDFLGKIN